MTTTLDADTATTAPIDTDRTGQVTEAVLICCALAWRGNPLAGLDVTAATAESLVRATRARSSVAEILAWRRDTEPDVWDLCWRWARRITRAHFGHALGLNELPIHHDELPDMTADTAAVPALPVSAR